MIGARAVSRAAIITARGRWVNDPQFVPLPIYREIFAIYKMNETVQLQINGEVRDLPLGLNVAELLAHLGIASNRVAIERNLTILPRDQWDQTAVSAGDRYEIVHLVGGG
jgi:sulfur carrier protein